MTVLDSENITLNKSVKIALSYMFSAMAAVITLLNITIPFPYRTLGNIDNKSR